MKRIYIISIITLFSLVACTDELDQKPISSATTLTFYQTTNDFLQGINSVYASLNAYPERALNLSETRSDNLYAVSDGGVRDWEGINSFHPTIAVNPYITEAWAADYNGIFRANNFLEQLAKNGSVITDPALKTRFEAEARFLRATLYLDLVRWFGKVPLIDKVVSQSEALTIGRSPVADIYKLIITDLQAAIPNLPSSYTGTNIGRVTNNAAKGLLALVYMTRSGPTYSIDGPGIASNEWGQALTLLNEVIASGKYSMLATYPSIFSYTNENNAEILFDIQFISGGLGLGTTFPVVLAPDSYFTANGLPNQTLTIRPISTDLLNSYGATDTRKGFNILSGYTANGVQETRSFFKKFIDLSKYGKSRLDWPINFIVMRYTDILMMKAECILQGAAGGGTQDDAIAIVNSVRKRAGLANITSLTLPQLMEERRKEFAGEGSRWHDLVRSGLVEKTITAWIPVEDVQKQMRPFSINYIIYPLPQSELDVRAGLYTQNLGY
jgi:starch-binding outer membrane protein, SusD/RagB family